ncbi:unnamed protein product [Pieris brassicae]|uniref:Peptidase S8 pro-domain domain-containing protein n=1 Tax=Pieris brassicae TaxID=7116 RepID=A0A9P0X6V8_PIEBR|nr:unnamed protein product [Pieris brassicae]
MARLALLAVLVLARAAWAHYTSTWAVHVPGGSEAADAVAADHGFINFGEVCTCFAKFLQQLNIESSLKT